MEVCIGNTLYSLEPYLAFQAQLLWYIFIYDRLCSTIRDLELLSKNKRDKVQ